MILAFERSRTLGAVLLTLAALLGGLPARAEPAAAPEPFKVDVQEVDDQKAVFATVRSKDLIEARVRTPGTIAALKIDEGSHVTAEQVIALVGDPKIALKLTALEAQIEGLEARVKNAKLDYERAEQLVKREVTPQARVDQLKTAFDVVTNELKAAQSERQVIEEQVKEGQVLAPAAGRVLKVPVTVGSVVMAGESLATIAANAYLLRLELPERHARFMKKGDPVQIGARGLSPDEKPVGEGRIVQVYPELKGGRVIADAEAMGLGDYFVGERALVWISAGKRKTIVVPTEYVFRRFGLDYLRLARGQDAATDVVVQTGRAATLENGQGGIEILAGLQAGDQIVLPAVQP